MAAIANTKLIVEQDEQNYDIEGDTYQLRELFVRYGGIFLKGKDGEKGLRIKKSDVSENDLKVSINEIDNTNYYKNRWEQLNLKNEPKNETQREYEHSKRIEHIFSYNNKMFFFYDTYKYKDILKKYNAIFVKGFDKETTGWIVQLNTHNEYEIKEEIAKYCEEIATKKSKKSSEEEWAFRAALSLKGIKNIPCGYAKSDPKGYKEIINLKDDIFSGKIKVKYFDGYNGYYYKEVKTA